MQQEAPQVRSARKCILLVEDEEDVRALVARSLRATYDVYEAADGLAALTLLPSIPRPDLVITDVSMPHLSGLTLATKLRAGALKGVPILFLSARDSVADIVAGVNSGARQYMTKPFKLNDLRARVDRILSKP